MREASLLVLLALFAPLQAQDLRVRAELDPPVVGLNQQFTLAVELSGNPHQASEPQLPDMQGFSSYIGSSSMQRMEIVNGRRSSSLTYQYSFLATHEGEFEIPPITVQAGGREYKTGPIKLTVQKGASSSSRSPSRSRRNPLGPDRDDPSEAVSEEELFLEAVPDRKRVYQGQPVIVEYRIYTLVNVTSFSVLSQPGTTGFWAEDFELPRTPPTHSEIRDGRRYTVATLKRTALFPTAPGLKAIDPMALECEVRVRSRDPFANDPFDRLLRGGLLGVRSVPVRVVSGTLEIEVLPFPEHGKPADFTGITGLLNVAASVDKTELQTDEAVTLKVRISGEGNLRTLPEPSLDLPDDFEAYPPKVSEKTEWKGDRVTGWKSFEYVLIPRAPGSRTIPAISMSYFDPDKAAYRTVTSDEIRLKVEGEVSDAPVIGGRRGRIRELRQDIRFIKTGSSSFQPLGQAFYETLSFWMVALLPLTALAGALGFRRHLDRLEGDEAYARKRRAGRLAKKRLAQARKLLDPSRQKEFYAETGRALLGFLGDKLNIAEAALISDQARSLLQQKGASAELVEDYLGCLETCDRQRFSPSEATRQEMSGFLDRSAQAMTQLDKEVR